MSGMCQRKKTYLVLLLMLIMTCSILGSAYADDEYEIANEEYLLKSEERAGNTYSDFYRTEDIKFRYADNSELEMDEMTDRDIRTRKIEFEDYRSDRFRKLQRLSYGEKVDLYGLRKVSTQRRDDLEIRMYRLDAAQEQSKNNTVLDQR